MALLLVGGGCGDSAKDEGLGVVASRIDSGQDLVIRQIYAAGTDAQQPYKRPFVQIYNRGTAPVSLTGLSVQWFIRSSGPTASVGTTALPAVSVAPGRSFLLAGWTVGGGTDIPRPDLIDDNFRPEPGLGSIALVKTTDSLSCIVYDCCGFDPGTFCPETELDRIIDLVGYKATPDEYATPHEGAAADDYAPYSFAGQAYLRKLDGKQDTNNNRTDFLAATPQPDGLTQAPAPIADAPPLSTVAATPFGDSTKFMYDGSPGGDQTGVAAGTIDPVHAGWITGYVKKGDGTPLAGATITVVDQSKYGQATSRSDGRFDLIVNGGATYYLRFAAGGFFSADRQVAVGWERTATVDDVLLVAPDSKGNALAGNSGSFQVASANKTVADSSTTKDRTAVLMVPPQTTFKAGSTVLPNITLRMTEYTAGSDGLKRMPAPLTGSPAYTYAVELSADGYEGQSIDFRDASNLPKDVFFYVEDFLTGPGQVGMPVGSKVPTGYYDRAKSAWVASKSGTVIKVSVNAGVASVDTDGDGAYDTAAQLTAFGITPAELTAIAAQYPSVNPAYLWRVPITHMTPFDCNWPTVLPPCEGGVCPNPAPPPPPPPSPQCSGGGGTPGGANGDSIKLGSIIRCDSQVLAEQADVAGTPYKLYYSSLRTQGYAPRREIQIDLTDGQPIHSKEVAISVDVSVAGQVQHREFTPSPNLSWIFRWDGLDGAGRPVVGGVFASVNIRRWYRGLYFAGGTVFGAPPNPTDPVIFSTRASVFTEREFESPLLGRSPVGSWSLGDWTLDQQHFLDVPSRTLYYGTGSSKPVNTRNLGAVYRIVGDGISTGFAADGQSATKAGTGLEDDSRREGRVAVGPDGTIYIADTYHRKVRRIDKAGNMWTIAGSGNVACGRGTPVPPDYANSATDATLSNISDPLGMAVAPDGSIFVIAGSGEQTIRKLTPLASGKYSITNITGGPSVCDGTDLSNASDNVPASQAKFTWLTGIALGPDGSIFVADKGAWRVYKIDRAGLITIVAGKDGTHTHNDRSGEGKLAKTVAINVDDVAAGPDESVYFRDNYTLVKVNRNGVLHYMNPPTSVPARLIADGVPMTTQDVDSVNTGLTMLKDGSLVLMVTGRRFANQSDSSFLRVVDPFGIVSTMAKARDPYDSQPWQIPGLAFNDMPPGGYNLAAAPNGDILTVWDGSVYRITSLQNQTLDVARCNDPNAVHLIPDGDSGYCFDSYGRHRKTIDLHTGGSLYTFTYDSGTGFVSSIKGPDNRTTSIVATASGYEITPEGGASQKTTITVSNGHATKISDSIGYVSPVPRADGLLDGFYDAENNQFSFKYGADGRLISDTSPLGTQTLARSVIPGNGRRVTHRTPIGNSSGGRATLYDLVKDLAGVATHTTTFPDGSTEVRVSDPIGIEKLTSRDATVTTTTLKAGQSVGDATVIGGSEDIRLPFNGIVQSKTRSVSDPVGGPQVTTTNYTSVTPNVQSTTTRTYSSSGETVVEISPAQRQTTTKYDATGRITQVQIGSASAGWLTPINFDQTGGHLNGTTQGARQTSNTYQGAGQVDAGYLFHAQDAAGYVNELRHDIRGHLTSTTAAFGTPAATTTGFDWYKHDALKSVTLPENTAALPMTHTFSYNAVKEIQQYLPPSLSGVANPATGYTYTADRDMFTETPAGLSQIARTYITNTGQLDTIVMPGTSLPGLAGTIDYDYYTDSATAGHAAGRISKITGPIPSNTVQYSYNGFLRTGIAWSGDVAGSVAWTYNNRFWRSKETLTAGAAFDRFLGYDADGLLVCNSPTNCNPAAWDALNIVHSQIHGQVTSIGIGTVSETWKYSDTNADYTVTPSAAYGELREQLASYSGTTLADIVYDAPGTSVSERRDALGRIRFKTETFRNATTQANETWKWEYIYDELGRLKTAKKNGSTVFDATYDKNGNVRTVAKNGGPMMTCSADAQDRLNGCTVAGSSVLTFQYYDNGEVKQKTDSAGTWKYHYDALGRLREVVTPGNTTIDYTVDGEGRRIAKKVNGVIQRRWIYGSGLSPVAELDGNGNLISRFIYASRQNTPDLVIRGTAIYRLISDQLGSPRYAVRIGSTTDAGTYTSGNLNEVPYQINYTPTGSPEVAGGLASSILSWIPFGFAGGLSDPDTGLVHFGARDYDASIGRWVSKDPILFDGGQTNIYVYVNNDPVNFMDPSGHDGFWSDLWNVTSSAIHFWWDPIKDWPFGPTQTNLNNRNPGECREPGRKPNGNWCRDAAEQGEAGWLAFCKSFSSPAMREQCRAKTYTSDQEKRNWCDNFF